MTDTELHQALLRPETYSEGSGPIEFRETHASRLYLTADAVYKIKKPVNFGFLDFSTLDRRRFFCNEEVRLNRRFAPGTYLGVVEIRKENGRIRLGDGSGQVCEFAVHMKRLPQEKMLDQMLARGAPGLSGEMERLGPALAGHHRESTACRRDGGRPNLDVVRFNWQENFEQTRPFAGGPLLPDGWEIVREHVSNFLRDNEEALLLREDEGYVREGHGDLHSEHICLTEPLQIYDCIEFNRRFRVADVAADLAFLLMDLEFRGARELSGRLLHSYLRESDGGDFRRLLPFYKIYRAWVRGKVESLLASDAEAETATREESANRARAYFNLALGYLLPPSLILIGGRMGTGKSTLARGIAASTGALVLRSDAIRKELAGDANDSSRAEFGKEIYTPDFTRCTYDELLKRALAGAAAGRPVLVDASFTRRKERCRFRLAARRAGLPLALVFTECPRGIALERLDRRRAEGVDISDGRRELFDLQSGIFEEPKKDFIRVDTQADVVYNVQFVLCKLIKTLGVHP